MSWEDGFKMSEIKEDVDKEFKPTFYGFTGGIRPYESMAAFCKRINKESG
jgi:hypothetical protein